MSFAENLKFLRKRQKMTQQQLADASGVSYSSIVNYENSRRTSPPLTVLQKLARALNVSVDELTAQRLAARPDGGLSIWFGEQEDLPVDDWEEFITERGERDIVEQLANLIRLLNKDGTSEALKRVRELTEIPRYVITLPPLKRDIQEQLKETLRRYRQEVTPCPEDAPPTAAEHNPGSDQTDAGNAGIKLV